MNKVLLTSIVFLVSIFLLSAQLNRLVQMDTGAHAHFGKRVALSQSNLLVAAPNFSLPGASRAGRVYWFELSGKTWTEKSPLPINSLKPHDQFGYDLSIYGSTLAVSAPGAGEGKVFIYELTSRTWQLSREITIPIEHRTIGLNFNFGQNIHLYGDWLAIAAPGYPAGDSVNIQTGVVFVFKKENNDWIFKQKIIPPDLSKHTLFSYDLVMSDSCLAISAPAADGGATESGVVFLYSLSNGSWTLDFTLIDPASRPYELFGNSIDLYQNRIAIGIPGRTNNLQVGPAGAVMVFRKSDQVWQQEALLKATDGGQNDLFGQTVSVQENRIIISAPRYDHAGYTDLGKAYVFQLDNGIWKESNGLIPLQMDFQSHLQFGASLDLFQSHLIISGHLLNDVYEDKGIAYATELEQSVTTNSWPDQDFHVYIHPNPTGGNLQINLGQDWGKDLQIHLYNLSGTPVIRHQFKSIGKNIDWQLESASVPPGAYFMYITDNKKSVVHKLIKL